MDYAAITRGEIIYGTLAQRLVLVALLLPAVTWAQQAVIDVTSIAQMVVQYATQVKQYAEQAQQTYNQYAQIKHELVMIEQGIKNLQHFDVNNAAALLSLGQQLQSKLAQARMLGYEANLVVSQAQGIYPRVNGLLTGEQLTTTRRQWAAAQREAATVGLQVQAMQADHAATMARIAALMNASSQTEGNLDSQQALAQGQGLMATQLERIQGHLATQARLQTLHALEEASLTEASSHALEEASGTIDWHGAPAGHLPHLSQ
jgi:P-type conjugative transfer protein TrbJ